MESELCFEVEDFEEVIGIEPGQNCSDVNSSRPFNLNKIICSKSKRIYNAQKKEAKLTSFLIL
jgi:hypothetical protein